MADDVFDDFIARQQAPVAGPAPVTAGNGEDVFDEFIKRTQAPPAAPQQTPEMPQQAPEMAAGQQTGDVFDEFVKQKPGYSKLLEGGFQRAIQSAKAAPDTWMGTMAALRGDLPLAREYMQKAEEIEKLAPEGTVDFKNIDSPDEFGRWLTEKFGENAINLLAAIPLGVTGGLAGQLAVRGISAAGVKAVMEAGKTVPSAKALQWGAGIGAGAATYPLTVGIETPQTAQEQFKFSPEFGPEQAQRALAAGLVKGMLELYTPMSIARALITPGMQLGKTMLGGMFKGFVKEGGTETGQEAIDIYARQLATPGYSYFKNGPTLMPEGWGEGMWRLAEAGTAGAFLGAPFGAAGQKIESRLPGGGVDTSLGTQRPGESYTIPAEPQAPGLPQEMSRSVHPQRAEIIKRYENGETVAEIAEALKIKPEIVRQETNPNISISDNRPEGVGQGPTGRPSIPNIRGQHEQNVERFKKIRDEGLKKAEGGPGPVTYLRNAVIPKGSPDKITLEHSATDPRDDVLGVDRLLATLPTSALTGGVGSAVLDFVEANTPRFVEIGPDGKPGNRLWTDTELELEFATNRVQKEEPRLRRVDQGMLQAAPMTALLTDLPSPGSERIYFLQGVSPQEQQELLQKYAQIHPFVKNAQGIGLVNATTMQEFQTRFQPFYDQLLTAGMRFIPSRGAGFHYNGVAVPVGEEITDLRSTKRAKGVALYDPMTHKITPFSSDERFYQDQVEQTRAIVVSVDNNKVREEDVIKNADGSFTLKGPLDVTQLTPGIRPETSMEDMWKITQTNPPGLFDNKKTYIDVTAVEDKALGRQYRDIVKQIAPAIDKIMDHLKIPKGQRIGFYISDKNSAQEGFRGIRAWWTQGIIEISPKLFNDMSMRGTNTGNLEATLLSVIMHELGHMVTYWYIQTLPVELQEKLWYAHQKAQLAYRMGDTSKTESAGATEIANQKYWLTFHEWLAEQFRRWATSDAKPVDFIQQSFKQGAKNLELYYRAWEQQFGAKSKVNLSEPDYYFSSWMDYLRDKDTLQKLIKQQTLYSVNQELLNTPTLLQITKQAAMALQSLEGIIPPEVMTRLNESLDPHIVPGMELDQSSGANARFVPDVNKPLIEIAVGSLPREDTYGASREIVAHEVMHSYEYLNIISDKEIAVLMEAINSKGPEEKNKLFNLNQQKALRDRVKAYGAIHGWSEGLIQAKFEQMRDREYRAHYIQMFADTGSAWSQESGVIATWIMAMIERVRNFMEGLGFQTKEDVVARFFAGEMVRRREMRAEQRETGMRSAGLIQEASSGGAAFKPYESRRVGDMRVGAMYENMVGTDKKTSKFVIYQWVDHKTGKVLGVVELSNKMPKGYNIEWIENYSDKFMLGMEMIAHAEKDLGMNVKPAGELTEAGFKQAQVLARARGQRDLMELYKPVKIGGITFHFSPNKIKEMYGFWLELTKNQNAREQYSKMLGSGTLISQKRAIEVLATYKQLYDRLTKENVWADPRLEQMFNLRRNNERDEVQGSLIRAGAEVEESRLLAAVGQGSPVPDKFRESFELKQKLSQGENARASGLSYELSAPATGLTLEIRNLFKSGELRKEWERAQGLGHREGIERELINVAHEADRIGWFTRYWWHIGQLVRANENAKNIQWLLNLYQAGEMMFISQNQWLQRANETARMWLDDVKGETRKTGLTNTVFALSEMDYLSAAEKTVGTTRMPFNWEEFLAGQAPVPNGELFRLFKKHGIDPRDYGVLRKINGDFKAFLDKTEQISLRILAKKFASAPAVHATALAELQKDMAALRAKPYFPHMRFGEFTVGVIENGKVVGAYAYETEGRRDDAIPSIRRTHPAADLRIGRVFPNHAEFMTLPGPLLKLVKEELFDKKGKGPEEIALIDKQLASIAEFELLHSPDRTFRKRWMPAHGIPGHSLDAHRAYSHYFMYGSRYISRLEFMDTLHEAIAEGKASIGQQGNYAKRAMIVDYAEKWLKYILEPGRDSGKFRAVVSLWFLGFSPAAAGMNYTQALVTLGTMGKYFGYGKAYSAVVPATSPQLFAKALGPGMPEYERAYAEMKRQGQIDIGQAANVAAYAEGYNLGRLTRLTRSQDFWHGLQYHGMRMFQATETHVRNHAMRHAWLLATQNPNAPRLQQLGVKYITEIADLQTPIAEGGAGLSPKGAIAFIFAKEAIKETQLVYSRPYDSPFMQGKQKDLLIFFKYTHGMLSHTFGRQGPTMHMLLMFALLYGLSGVPFAEDGNEVIKAIARKLFGKDVDLLKNARAFVKSVVRDGPFDKTGPDLAMHGISRYGFGLGFLPQHWAAPRFDASANGSMGKVVPGLSELAHGMATGKKFSDVFAESAQRASGAGYGVFYTMMQFMMEGPSADSKKWEQLLQREMRALAKAYRYADFGGPDIGIPFIHPGLPNLGVLKQQGAETTRGGAKIVRFNPSDPEDIATVLMQAAGFTPTKVAQKWEGLRAVQEDSEIYKMRKMTLYVQAQKAMMDKSSEAWEDVMRAVTRYNEEVGKIDPGEVIKTSELRQSLQQRQRDRVWQETVGARNKRELMIMERLKDLYPGLTVEKVK